MKTTDVTPVIWNAFPRARRAPTYEYIDDTLAVDLRTVVDAKPFAGQTNEWTRHTMQVTFQ